MVHLSPSSLRKAPWHSRAVRRTAEWLERLTFRRVVNVRGGAKRVGRVLSNFTLAPFQLDGVNCPSFEAFWQSLKFNSSEPMHRKVAQMRAGDAKRAGSRIRTQIMFYQGEILSFGSKELFELAKRAERARFEHPCVGRIHAAQAHLFRLNRKKEKTLALYGGWKDLAICSIILI